MSIYQIYNKKIKYNHIHNKLYYPVIYTMSNHVAFLRSQNHKTLMYIYEQNIKNHIIPISVIDSKPSTNKLKIVLYMPPPSVDCGGIMVMHNLAKSIINLNNSNIEVYIYYYDHRVYNNEFCNNFFNPFNMDDNTLVIYPETIIGNPLNAKYVARWILLELGLDVGADQYKNWNPNDIVYHWEPSQLKNTKQLVDIWINPIITRYNYNKRYNTCYGIKKMQWIPQALHPKGLTKYHDNSTINIDIMSIDGVIKTFNESIAFYCYDPNTFYSVMAPLCGCITVLHPLHNIDKKNFFKSRILYHKDTNFYFDSGIAYGNSKSEIKNAFKTVDSATEKFIHLVELYRDTVRNFVEDSIKLVSGEQLNNTVDTIYNV